jgi:CRP-like cAMP-binding protein
MHNGHESRVEALRVVPMFADLSEDQLRLLAHHAEEVDVEANEVLVRQGDRGDKFILILEGGARVERDGQVLAHLSTNQFLGEMSLLDGKPRAATVTTESPGKVLVISTETFHSLMDSVPEFRDKLILVLCERLRGLQAPRVAETNGHSTAPVDLDRLYVLGEIYDTLDVCDQIAQSLSRLGRHGLLGQDDLEASRRDVDAIRARLEHRLEAGRGSA